MENVLKLYVKTGLHRSVQTTYTDTICATSGTKIY